MKFMSLLTKVSFLLKFVSTRDKCIFHSFSVGYFVNSGISNPAFVPQSDQILLCLFWLFFFFLNTKPSTYVGVRNLDYAEELGLKWI